MKITGSRQIAASTTEVTTILQNGRQLVQAIPDLQLNAPLDDRQQRVTLSVAIGPLQGQYEIVTVVAQPETAVFTIQFDGHGAKGIFHGNGRLHLEAQDDQTVIRYEGEIEVAGQLAELPPRLLQANVNAIIRRCLDGIERSLWPEKFAAAPESAATGLAWMKTAVATALAIVTSILLIRIIGRQFNQKAESER